MSRPPDHADEIERLVERAARDPRTHTFARLADLYRKVGELDRALEVIQTGLKHHPHYLNARLVHARLLRDMGRPDEAVAAFARVLEIDSENRVARAALDELTGEPAPDDEAGAEAAAAGPPPSVGWLARLDAEWRHAVTENGTEARPEEDAPEAEPGVAGDSTHAVDLKDDAESERRAAPEATAAPKHAAEPKDAAELEDAGVEEDEGDAELETGTLAALYVTQGLFDKAIALYERLLARDPYNARLAADLEDARQRGTTGRPAGRRVPPARPGPVPPPEVDEASDGGIASTPAVAPAPAPRHDEPAAEPGEASVPAESSISEYLKALLEGRAPVDQPPGRTRRWPDWLTDIGV